MKTALCAALLLLCSCPALFSQTKHPSVRIVFECQCQDDTGTRFATAFRELLVASPRYAEVTDAIEHPAGDKTVLFNWHVKAGFGGWFGQRYGRERGHFAGAAARRGHLRHAIGADMRSAQGGGLREERAGEG